MGTDESLLPLEKMQGHRKVGNRQANAEGSEPARAELVVRVMKGHVPEREVPKCRGVRSIRAFREVECSENKVKDGAHEPSDIARKMNNAATKEEVGG